ncbi:MAG: ribosomal L7Ae/L30e/S12e/Gadd45 family protein [Oscillospiraceae bacterium]|nr:ribosomal L7Ae/L30e/S12e/Gadd45 family protein [Oscillospiraceae bacterium]
MNERRLGMSGTAKRAGPVPTGEFICAKSIKAGIAKLVIIACDASDNTKKSLTNSCKYYNVRHIECGTMADLGKYTGSSERAVVSVNDNNFAKAILDRFRN